MVFYQFQQAGNEEFQSMKKWNSAVGIVAAGANGTVAAGWGDELKSHLFLVHFSVLFSSKNE